MCIYTVFVYKDTILIHKQANALEFNDIRTSPMTINESEEYKKGKDPGYRKERVSDPPLMFSQRNNPYCELLTFMCAI